MNQDPNKSTLAKPWFWFTIAILVWADIASKEWAWQFYGLGVQPVLGNVLSWQTVHNPGGIFGMGQSFTIALTIIRVFAVALIFILVHRQSASNRLGIATLTLLVSGALGNLYDNLSPWMPWTGNGEVRDFIRVFVETPTWWPGAIPWPFAPWPIFNIADALICIGFIFLISGKAVINMQSPETTTDDDE